MTRPAASIALGLSASQIPLALAAAWAGTGAVQGSRRRLNLMPDNSQVDDEREPLTDDEIERLAQPARPGMKRYDRRAVAQSVREQRKRERELRKIDRSNRKMAELLEGRDDLASMRLLFEINERQRDRIMGKPFISDPPSQVEGSGVSRQPPTACRSAAHHAAQRRAGARRAQAA